MLASKVKIMLDENKKPYLASEKTNVIINENKICQTSADVYHMAFQSEIIRQGFESVYMLMYDTAGHFISMSEVAKGGINATNIPVREICQTALLAGATSVIMLHNHPAGSLEPSEEDIRGTFLINNALKLVGITLDDHIIVSYEGYKSMAEMGLVTLEFTNDENQEEKSEKTEKKRKGFLNLFRMTA